MYETYAVIARACGLDPEAPLPAGTTLQEWSEPRTVTARLRGHSQPHIVREWPLPPGFVPATCDAQLPLGPCGTEWYEIAIA